MRPRPKRRLGQHFLEPAWVDKLVAAIRPERGQTFLEVGAGPGVLTLALAGRGVSVTAVEIDRELADDLAARAPATVTVVTADIPLLGQLAPGDWIEFERCDQRPARRALMESGV